MFIDSLLHLYIAALRIDTWGVVECPPSGASLQTSDAGHGICRKAELLTVVWRMPRHPGWTGRYPKKGWFPVLRSPPVAIVGICKGIITAYEGGRCPIGGCVSRPV